MRDLAAVASEWNLGEHMKDPERWLTRQITSGRILARKIGRHWMMTDADIAYALEVFASRPPVRPGADADISCIGLSAASARRRGARQAASA